MAANTSFFVNRFISGRDFFSESGIRIATVQANLYVAVTREGALEYFTNMADSDTPTTPKKSNNFGLILLKFFIWNLTKNILN